jgi:hypothetical protein
MYALLPSVVVLAIYRAYHGVSDVRVVSASGEKISIFSLGLDVKSSAGIGVELLALA